MLSIQPFFFLASIIILFLYFQWLIESTTTIGLTKLIISRFNINSIKAADKKLASSNKNFLDINKKQNSGIKYRPKEIFDFHFDQDIVINSQEEGYITKIDFQRIDNILSEYKDEIDEVIFVRFLKDHMSRKDFYPNVNYNQPILKIRTKLALVENELKIKISYNKIESKILKCFSIDKNTYFLEGNLIVLKELVQVLSYSFELNRQDNEKLLFEIQGFIVKLDNSFRNRKSEMMESFLIVFLDEINSLIWKTHFTN